ncbi:MAG: 3-keto-5-aminohexanoate cleavage protein [Deltaproteobacteria bacterium]|nr:3-keto-5-aminohexanoate cleavage protein [Deltaproteobacteria bacterium]
MHKSAEAIMKDKVVITCAVTGVLANRKQCPWVPYTPEEIGEECQRAYEAGASVCHIHARDPDSGGPAFGPAIYQRIHDEVRKRSPVLVNFSTGAIGMPVEEKIAHIPVVRPAIAALNMGSMNYAKYSEKRKDFVFDLLFANPFGEIVHTLRTFQEHRVKPELECFDSGHTNSIWPLLDLGVLTPPLQFSFILGVVGGIPATAEALAFQKAQIPDHSQWEVIGISHEQWLLVAAALSLGGNVRVGLEDNFYVAPGVMAKSNGELVAKAARMARDVGREPASVAEARKILGIPDDRF